MEIRFLDLVESQVAGCPFVRGQVIAVAQMTPAIRLALMDGRAEVIRDEEPEFAAVAPRERAVTRGRRGRA